MTVLLAAMRGGLVRLGLVLLVGSSLAYTLGLLYPVHRELDLGRYEYPSYAYEVEGVFPPSVVPAVSQAMGPGACLISVWMTKLQAGASQVGPTELDVTAPTCSGDSTRFPARLQVAESAVATRNWIDVNADAAQALGVSPGDNVEVMLGPDLPPVRLIVRRVFALRATGAAAAAMAPSEALFPHLPGGQQLGYGLALVRTPVEQFMPKLEAGAVKEQLEQAKGYPPIATAASSRLRTADELSSNSLGLVRTIGALAALGVLLLSLRELDVFRRRWLPAVQLVHNLGGSASWLLFTMSAMAAVVSAAAVSAGLALARSAYTFGVVASCMPPTLEPLLIRVWAVAAFACILFCSALGLASHRRVFR